MIPKRITVTLAAIGNALKLTCGFTRLLIVIAGNPAISSLIGHTSTNFSGKTPGKAPEYIRIAPDG